MQLIQNITKFLTAGCDSIVYLYDVTDKGPLSRFLHRNIVTAISFLDTVYILIQLKDDFFVSGSLDKLIRLWDIKNEKLVNYINMQDYITAVAVFPNGNSIIVGNSQGKCLVYDLTIETNV